MSDDEYEDFVDLDDHKNVCRLMETCVAQSNHYSSTPGAMYFMARHNVLAQFSTDIRKLYKEHCSGRTAKSDSIRDQTYAAFYRWYKSEDFTENIDPSFSFSEPYLVGSAWTPLRTPESNIDVVIIVNNEGVKSLSHMEKPRETFVKALCTTFVNAVSILAKRNTIILKMDSARKLCIHLFPSTPYIPFTAHFTWGLNQYDDFLDDFSAMALFLHKWFAQVKSTCKGTARVAIPNSTAINYLLVFFLQYYQQIPTFYFRGMIKDPTKNSQGHLDFNILPYTAELYHFFKFFDIRRKVRKPNTGEIMTMFFFFYGYLINLPDVSLNVAVVHIFNKLNDRSYCVSLMDSEKFQGREVPDAHRLQFLFRQAFHTIKNTEGNASACNRLMAMIFNINFNAVRDRVLREDPDPTLHDNFQKVYLSTIEEDTENEESNYIGATEIGNFIAKRYGERTLYKSKAPILLSKAAESLVIPAFSKDMQAIKDFFTKPSLEISPLAMPSNWRMVERANDLFQITVLPNPNDFSDLSVIFRAPQREHRRLIPIVANYADDAIELDLPIIEGELNDKPTYFDSVKTKCYEELEEQIKVRKFYLAASKNREKHVQKMRLLESAAGRPKLTKKEVREECQKMDIGKGFMTFADFEKNLKKFEKYWFTRSCTNE